MKITRKSRKIKSRNVGMVDDINKWFYDDKYIDPAIRSGWRDMISNRGYSDEIPLPDADFCIQRSYVCLLQHNTSEQRFFAATAWVNLSCNRQAFENNLKNI